MDGTSIPENMRGMVGKESEPKVLGQVYEKDIRRFVQATGDRNPLYIDEAYAKRGPYHGIIAPPLFIFTFAYEAELAKLSDDGIPAHHDVHLIPGKRIVGGGSELNFLVPLRPGDVLSVKNKLLDIYEKEGKTGRLIFVVQHKTYMNQHAEVVAVEKGTLVLR